jgi:hypothetical protein
MIDVLYGEDGGTAVAEVRPRLRVRQGVGGIGAPNEVVICQQVADQDEKTQRWIETLFLGLGYPPVCSGREPGHRAAALCPQAPEPPLPTVATDCRTALGN